jgi:hypothetical protein
MRRAARSLVEPRTLTFESRHPLEESQRRFADVLARMPISPPPRASWHSTGSTATLAAELPPSPRTKSFLSALSLGMAMLIAASAWTLTRESGSLAFLLPLTTALAILGFPILVLALASQREAREATFARAVRAALRDEDAAYPPPRRWEDDS